MPPLPRLRSLRRSKKTRWGPPSPPVRRSRHSLASTGRPCGAGRSSISSWRKMFMMLKGLMRQQESQVAPRRRRYTQEEQQCVPVRGNPCVKSTLNGMLLQGFADAVRATYEAEQRMEECSAMFPDTQTVIAAGRCYLGSRVVVEDNTTVLKASPPNHHLRADSRNLLATDPEGCSTTHFLNTPAIGCSTITSLNTPAIGCSTITSLNTPAIGCSTLTSLNTPVIGSHEELRKVEDIRELRQPAKGLLEAGLVYAIHQEDCGTRYARVNLVNTSLFLHSLQNQCPPLGAVTVRGDKPEDCHVCMTAFNDTVKRPCSLPCGHTFCSLCVDGLIKKDEVTCPTCRDIHDVPKSGRFPVNYVLEAVIQRRQREQETLFCSPCQPDKDTETEESSSPAVISSDDTDTEEESSPPVISSDRKTSKSHRPLKTVVMIVIGLCLSVLVYYYDDIGTLPRAAQQANEKDSVDGATTGKLRKDATLPRLRSLLQEQEDKVVAALTACQEVQAQLGQYRATLQGWEEQHQQLEENVMMLKGLMRQQESQVAAKKKAVQQEEQQLRAVLGTLRQVNTERDALAVVADAVRATYEAEQRMEECSAMFPDTQTVIAARKVSGLVMRRMSALRNSQRLMRISDLVFHIMWMGM
ncbi:Tripartite motif-containing protein 59 [Chionoecetes opilio]|uniref:Tripartite motif-containing protein 59 n=1 Tax=Chionoecetes opilio TaxID=41210 RepID=A0A8J4Y3T0_CHIOP|nr:Tripartite motif-containing protein 59 [Chionoecetes opilio]